MVNHALLHGANGRNCRSQRRGGHSASSFALRRPARRFAGRAVIEGRSCVPSALGDLPAGQQALASHEIVEIARSTCMVVRRVIAASILALPPIASPGRPIACAPHDRHAVSRNGSRKRGESIGDRRRRATPRIVSCSESRHPSPLAPCPSGVSAKSCASAHVKLPMAC